MNETGKVLCGFFAVVAGFIAAAAWSLDPVGNVWTVRILFTAVSAALFLLLLRALFKKDLAPDYIRMVSGSVFERSGFQFATEPIHLEDHCCFRIWYQNRHAKPCTARILLTPQKTFLMKVPRVGPVSCEISVPPAGFGWVLIPVNTEKAFHGKRVTFGVYASTHWKEGKGELLRFRDGSNVGTLPGSSRDQLMSAAAFAAGSSSTPAKIEITVPFEVAEKPTIHRKESLLWQLGERHNPFEE